MIGASGSAREQGELQQSTNLLRCLAGSPNASWSATTQRNRTTTAPTTITTMSLSLSSLRGLASRLLARPSSLLHRTTTEPSPIKQCLVSTTTVRAFSTSPPSLAPPAAKKKGSGSKKAAAPAKQKPKAKAQGGKAKRGKGEEPRDPRTINMLRHFAVLSPRRIPAPLRMARNRHLRHWVIHRAWLLFRRREREARERTLMRQYQSISAACEELRLTSGPGTRDEGYLFRVAMDKRGVYGLHGIPIEYGRAQTETPARVAWNHDWKP